MKYLCLAYGSTADWQALARDEQAALLAQDDVLRTRGDLVAAVRPSVATLRAWDGTPALTDGSFGEAPAPLAGFCIVEAADISEVIQLMAGTPCARARGAIEVRPIAEMNDVALASPSSRRP